MKVSIITPTRNRLPYLKEAVASVRMSVKEPMDLEIEHVILDCGSDDGTAEWLQSEEAKGLTVVLKDGPIPPGQARNLAIEHSSGELIILLDDDDILLQRTAYHFAETLQKSSAQWTVADFLKIDSEGRYLPGEDYYTWRFSSAQEMLEAIFHGRHFIQGNVCFRRELFDKVGGYSEMRTAEDLELYSRFVMAAGLPAYLMAVSHLHRVHDSNTSRDIGKQKFNEDLSAIYEMHRSELERRGIALQLVP